MNKVSQLEKVEINERDNAYLGLSIAISQGGHQFVILAGSNDGIEEAWYRLGGDANINFKEVKPAAIVSREFFDAVRPKYDAPSPGMETRGDVDG